MQQQKKQSRMRVLGVFATLALAFGLAFGMAGCSQNGQTQGSAPVEQGSSEADAAKTVTFTDDAGREVELPAKIDKIVPSGHTANMVLLTIAPEKMVGLSQELTEDQQKYLGDRVAADLPVLGAAFGAKGDLNKEAVAATGAQVLIDTGEMKDGIAEDLDALQEQLGIPCVFIESKLEDWGSAYEKLGQLLGEEERGEELAAYCQDAYDEVQSVMEQIPEDQRVSVLYCLGETGTNVIAQGSFQANVVDMVANNAAVVDAPMGKGTGNESSLEQISVWNPDVILFGPNSVYDQVATDPTWSSLSAIASGNYYEVPGSPYNWLNNPPTVNQVLGMQWLARLLYPQQFEDKDSIEDVVKDYYETFYGYKLSDAECQDLLAKATPQAE